jgi:nitrite reductase/ring-hydroxylating ferredoxin subunit
MEQEKELYPFPDGWYMLAASADLRPGGVLSKKLGGEDLVVFRTASGKAAVLDAHCPHLGANLGHGGCVHGETIQCPFHGLRFNTAGRCVATPLEDSPDFRRRIRTWEVREVNGFVLVYYSSCGEPPNWEVPAVDGEGWTQPRTRSLEVPAHPQETSENSVDLAHFAVVHGYSEVELVDRPQVEGRVLRTRFEALRRFPFLPYRLSQLWLLDLHYDVEVWGPGYSVVLIRMPQFGFRVRFWVLSTHTDGERVCLTLAVSTELRPVAHREGWARFLPWPLIARVLRYFILVEGVHDVLQDTPIWANKIHLDPPELVKGDGPIGHYRRYVRQFYPSAEERSATRKMAS